MIHNELEEDEEMNKIIDLLSDIATKLDRNYNELRRLTDITRQATSVILNCNEGKETVHASLSSLEQNTVVSSNCIFAGYKRSSLIDYMISSAQSNNCSFIFARGVVSVGDFMAALTKCQDNDVILFDYSEIDRTSEIIPLFVDAIEDKSLYVRIGKGSSSNLITMDLPKIHIHLFAASELLIPKEIECCFDSIYVNE